MKKNIISELVNVSFNFFVCMTFPAYWIQVELRKCIVTFFFEKRWKISSKFALTFCSPSSFASCMQHHGIGSFLERCCKEKWRKIMCMERQLKSILGGISYIIRSLFSVETQSSFNSQNNNFASSSPTILKLYWI